MKTNRDKLSAFIYLSITVLFSLLMVVGENTYSQGSVDGFYKGRGNIDFVLSGGVEFADKYYAGKNLIGVSRNIYNSNLFIAAGLTNDIDLNMSLPYVAINDERSIQDGSINLKSKLFQQNINNGTLTGSISLGYSKNLALYQTEGLNAIGQRAKVIDVRPFLHYYLENGWFGTLQVAYDYKFDPVPNAYNASIKIGRVTSKNYFDIWYDYQASDGGLDYRGITEPSTFRELGVDYNKVGATFYRRVSKSVGVSAGTFYVLNGRNIGKGIGANIGLVFKFNP